MFSPSKRQGYFSSVMHNPKNAIVTGVKLQVSKSRFLPQIPNLIRKLRRRGFRWFIRRLREERRAPHYSATLFTFSAVQSLVGRAHHFRSKKYKAGKDFLACYSLSDAVTSYDFAYFLAYADAEARKAGFDDFHVALVQRPLEEVSTQSDDGVRGPENAFWRLLNIVIPLASLYPSCSGYRIFTSKDSLSQALEKSKVFPAEYSWDFYPPMQYAQVVKSLSRNEFGGFSAPTRGLNIVSEWLAVRDLAPPIVSITIRNRKWDSSRNSNIGEWTRFAKMLREIGCSVVFVPEADTVEKPGMLWEFEFAEATWNLGLRLSLYEISDLNFIVDNGPAALMHLDNSVKYLQTFQMTGLPIKTGVKHLPYGNSGQMLNWGEDTFENLLVGLDGWEAINGKLSNSQKI
jgi:hypothetical protein